MTHQDKQTTNTHPEHNRRTHNRQVNNRRNNSTPGQTGSQYAILQSKLVSLRNKYQQELRCLTALNYKQGKLNRKKTKIDSLNFVLKQKRDQKNSQINENPQSEKECISQNELSDDNLDEFTSIKLNLTRQIHIIRTKLIGMNQTENPLMGKQDKNILKTKLISNNGVLSVTKVNSQENLSLQDLRSKITNLRLIILSKKEQIQHNYHNQKQQLKQQIKGFETKKLYLQKILIIKQKQYTKISIQSNHYEKSIKKAIEKCYKLKQLIEKQKLDEPKKKIYIQQIPTELKNLQIKVEDLKDELQKKSQLYDKERAISNNMVAPGIIAKIQKRIQDIQKQDCQYELLCEENIVLGRKNNNLSQKKKRLDWNQNKEIDYLEKETKRQKTKIVMIKEDLVNIRKSAVKTKRILQQYSKEYPQFIRKLNNSKKQVKSVICWSLKVQNKRTIINDKSKRKKSQQDQESQKRSKSVQKEQDKHRDQQEGK